MHALVVMLDTRWTELKDRLVQHGWVCRDDTLFAPHATLWLGPTSKPRDLVTFRERIAIHCEQAARVVDAHGRDADDYRELYEDLTSLISALDAVIGEA